MLTQRHVTLALRLGMLAHRADVPEAAADAVRLLADGLGGDAASLVTVDPFEERFVPLSDRDYPEPVAHALAGRFPRTPWMRQVLGEPLPPSISTEAGQSFRRGWFYAEWMEPAGFRDGMSAPLRVGGRCVGLVHVSTGREGRFGTEARQLLGSLAPALARLVDVGRVAAPLPGTAAALVSGSRETTIAGRPRPDVLDDPLFRGLVAEFARSGSRSLDAYWPVGASWVRVLLRRTGVPGACRSATAVLTWVAAVPYGLSRRELEVLTLVAAGLTNEAVADRLVLSERTVHSHVRQLLRKTGCSGRAQAAALAVRDGLLRPLPGTRGEPGDGGTVARLAVA